MGNPQQCGRGPDGKNFKAVIRATYRAYNLLCDSFHLTLRWQVIIWMICARNGTSSYSDAAAKGYALNKLDACLSADARGFLPGWRVNAELSSQNPEKRVLSERCRPHHSI